MRLGLITPGRLVENAYIESFSGKLRQDRLQQHWFASLAEAVPIVEGRTTTTCERIVCFGASMSCEVLREHEFNNRLSLEML